MNIGFDAEVGPQILAVERFQDPKFLAFWMFLKFRLLIVSPFECAARFYLTKGWTFPRQRIRCALMSLLLFRGSIPSVDAIVNKPVLHFRNLIHPG